MSSRNRTLQEMLVADLPPGFVRTLLDEAPAVYREAHAVVQGNPSLGDPEAQYLLGHQRRAHFEAMLRDAAVLHGVEFTMERSKDDDGHSYGFQHVRVTASRFAFTACHVQSPERFRSPHEVASSTPRSTNMQPRASCSPSALLPRRKSCTESSFIQSVATFKARFSRLR